MAVINFSEIRDLLRQRGSSDATPDQQGEDGYYVEISFEGPPIFGDYEDKELKGRVITAECAYGTVTIVFDGHGLLRSIDVS